MWSVLLEQVAPGKGTVNPRCFRTQGRSSVMWQDIHAICECRVDIQPVHCCVIRKNNGEVCVGPEETLCRWREHVKGVLNVISSFNQAVFDGVEQFLLRSELAEPPDRDEIWRANVTCCG